MMNDRARTAEIREAIDDLLDEYDSASRGGAVAARAARQNIAAQLLDLAQPPAAPAGAAQAWAILARTLAGDHYTSRQLRAVLSHLIELLDEIRTANASGPPACSSAEERRIREQLLEAGFDVELYRGQDRVAFLASLSAKGGRA